MKQVRRPRYWQLDGLMLAMLAIVFWINQAGLPAIREQLLEIAVVNLGFVLVGVWIVANADALEAE